ncbi:MAG: sulfotransferase family protein [Candidatus Muiribacteriota bacterium]
MKPKVCLIGGTSRSGTKILKWAFKHHPDFKTIPNIGEWRIITDPDGIVDFYNSLNAGWSPYYFDTKLRRLKRILKLVGRVDRLNILYEAFLQKSGIQKFFPYHLSQRYIGVNLQKHCPGYKKHVNQLIENLTQFKYRACWDASRFGQRNDMSYHHPFDKDELAKTLQKFLRNIIASIVKQKNAKHFIEDSTFNICWFDKILEILPEAKLVHIYRDPRDVVASFKQQTFTPRTAKEAALFYKGMIKQWERVKKKLPKDKYLEISLESLVAEPEKQLKNVCRFYGVKYEKDLLKTKLKPTGRWKKDLTKSEQKIVQKILKDEIRMLGY